MDELTNETGFQVGPPPPETSSVTARASEKRTTARRISFSPTVTEIQPERRSGKKTDQAKLGTILKRKIRNGTPGAAEPPKTKVREGAPKASGEGKGSSSATALVGEHADGGSGTSSVANPMDKTENLGGGKPCEVYIGNRVEFNNCP